MKSPTSRPSASFELRQLRCFLAVIDSGSFSRAAIRMGVSQQAVSQIIRSLEENLGVRLLDRNPRQSAPTAFGRLLLEHARKIDAECASFDGRLARAIAAGDGQVRLGASPTASIHLVTEALLTLKNRSAGFSVDVVSATLFNALDPLLRGDVDLFVGLDNGEVPVDGLEKEILGMETYCVIAGAQHPFAKCDEVAFDALAASNWVLGDHLGAVEEGWRQAFRDRGLAPPVVEITTSSLEFCKTMLMSSLYLTVLPTQLVEAELENGTLKCIATRDLQWQRPIALLYRSLARERGGVLAVIDAIHRAAAKLYKQPPQEVEPVGG